MSGRDAVRRRAVRGPAPTEAGTTLLAHELKNLASRLALLCGNLRSSFEDPLFRQSAVGLLNDTASSLRRLAGEVRDRGGRMIVKVPVRMDEVVRDAVRDRLPRFEPGVVLSEEYEEVDPIYGDAFLLRKAFGCVLENALEALGGRGFVKVRCRGTRGRRPRIHVEFVDNGPGMSETFLRESFFRPFATTKENGLGLGIYTVRQVTSFHGGRITVDTVEGRGTSVRFSFPTGDAP